MKKLRLFTAFISLFMIIGCSKNEDSASNIDTPVEDNNGGLVTPPDGGENNNSNQGENNNTNEGENNNEGGNNQGTNNENNENNSGEEQNNENKDVLVESLTFNKSEISLIVNRGYTVEYDIKPLEATNKNLRWASSDYEVAAVSKEGRISALGEGTATITATTMDGSKISDSIEVTVNAIAVNELDLEVKNKEMEIGEKFKIKPLIYPTNATYQGCTFVSQNESVATVDSLGYVTAVGKGETDITVTSEKYPDVSINFHVSCFSIIAEKLNYRLTDLEIKEGENYFFTPTVFPTNTTNKGLTYSNTNPEVVSVSESGEIYALAAGTATVTATSKSNPELSTSLVVTVKGSEENIKTTLSYTYKDFAYNNIANVDNANYKTTHALIVPVWFTDSNNYISNKKAVRDDIEKAYLGTNEETGWRSVKTFYEEEGRGRYTLTGFTTDWFECNLPSRNYYSGQLGSSRVETLVKSAVKWYKTTYGVEDMKGFDADSNGYIDAVVLIYGAPDYGATENYNASNMWAYTSWLCDEKNRSYDDPGANAFFWASYDFMYGEDHPHNSTYHSGDTRYCELDTHTYIHEFGHVLGLNDYYDYSQQYSPAGGFSMQDQNVGSHDPYSLLTYGFIDPYIITDEATITINDFQSSGDVVLLANKTINSPFDEYILLELYTPTGLNEFDTMYQYCGAGVKGIDDVGIRIWHVDGRLVYAANEYDFDDKKITTNPLIEGYKVWNMMSNTYYSYQDDGAYGSPLGKNYMDYNELQLIRNDTKTTHKDKNHFSSKCLFKEGDTFSVNKFQKQFFNQYYLNDGSYFSFKVEVTKIEDNKATLTITK